MTGVGDVRRSDSRHQEGGVLCTTKTRMVIRASQYCGPLRIRRQRWTAGRRFSAAALNLSSGNAGSCWMRWYPCFGLIVMVLTYSAESVLLPGRPESRRGESGKSVYRDSLIPLCQSCIPAGIFAIYKADKEIESFHGELPDFPLHTFILHKHPLLTTSLLKTYQSLMRKPRALQ